jgi:hypothetical protein
MSVQTCGIMTVRLDHCTRLSLLIICIIFKILYRFTIFFWRIWIISHLKEMCIIDYAQQFYNGLKCIWNISYSQDLLYMVADLCHVFFIFSHKNAKKMGKRDTAKPNYSLIVFSHCRGRNLEIYVHCMRFSICFNLKHDFYWIWPYKSPRYFFLHL